MRKYESGAKINQAKTTANGEKITIPIKNFFLPGTFFRLAFLILF